MDTKIIDECTALSLEGKTPFPEILGRLIGAGVERYIVDMVGRQKFNYGINGESYTDVLEFEASEVATVFDAVAVKSAITNSQQGKINYREFLKLVTASGCCHYEVFITGKKVIYFGRDGSNHVELFPSPK